MKTSAILIVLAFIGVYQGGPSHPSPDKVEINLDHILEGRVNYRGDLVGVHHAPSAPARMRVEGVECDLEIERTSEGGEKDVRTARVRLRDPATGEVKAEKFSTLYPDAWTAEEIETAIREAYGDALKRKTVDRSGRWEGRTKSGVRIDGFMTRNGRAIASAFPVYIRPRGERRR